MHGYPESFLCYMSHLEGQLPNTRKQERMASLCIFTHLYIGLAILLRMLSVYHLFRTSPGTQNPLHLWNWNRQKSFPSFLTLGSQSWGEAKSKGVHCQGKAGKSVCGLLQKKRTKKSRPEKLEDLKWGKTKVGGKLLQREYAASNVSL